MINEWYFKGQNCMLKIENNFGEERKIFDGRKIENCFGYSILSSVHGRFD